MNRNYLGHSGTQPVNHASVLKARRTKDKKKSIGIITSFMPNVPNWCNLTDDFEKKVEKI